MTRSSALELVPLINSLIQTNKTYDTLPGGLTLILMAGQPVKRSKNCIHFTFMYWLIAFYQHTNSSGLFYAKRLEKYIHYMFIFTIFCSFFFSQLYDKYSYLIQIIYSLWYQVFLSNTNNLQWYQVFLFNTNFHTAVWFQIFLLNMNNLNNIVSSYYL